MNTKSAKTDAVSTRSRPKAAGCRCRLPLRRTSGFNTQPPKGGWAESVMVYKSAISVSTRSRPKAAGLTVQPVQNADGSFNTQPPEGGWNKIFLIFFDMFCFNTQPPEGGWRHYANSTD